jgi:hypothetical protein
LDIYTLEDLKKIQKCKINFDGLTFFLFLFMKIYLRVATNRNAVYVKIKQEKIRLKNIN